MKANMHEVDTMTIARTVRKDKTNTNLNCVVPEFFSSCRMKRNVDLITRNQFLVFSMYKRISIFNRVNHVRPCSFMTNQSIRRWAVSLLNADFYWWVIFLPFFLLFILAFVSCFQQRRRSSSHFLLRWRTPGQMTRTDELVTCAICDPFLTKEEEKKNSFQQCRKIGCSLRSMCWPGHSWLRFAGRTSRESNKVNATKL